MSAKSQYSTALNNYNASEAAYKSAHDAWLADPTHTTMPTKNFGLKPDFIQFLFPKVIIGVIIIFISLVPIFIGAAPFMTKAELKLTEEHIDYVGEDYKRVASKTIDVAKPIINKGVNEIVAPAVGSIAKQIKEPGSTTKNSICTNCGNKVESDEMFCSNCGNQLKQQCPYCNTLNSKRNKYCKKCGKQLK